MKRILCILLAAVLLMTACTMSQDKSSSSMEALVSSLMDIKVHSVIQNDPESLLSILDPEDQELRTEQMNWLKDIRDNPIEGYSLKLLRLEKINEGIYKAKLRQQYRRGAESYTLDFYNKYKWINNKLYDAGNYFDELRQGSITIEYTPTNKKLAEGVIEDINGLYKENIERWGITHERQMVGKMFEEI